MNRPRFSDDFKRDAVHQVVERGYPVAEVSPWFNHERATGSAGQSGRRTEKIERPFQCCVRIFTTDTTDTS